MHILYIHQYFATPTGRTGTRSYEFARRWVKQGHRVTMLTSTAQMTDADFGGECRRFITRVTIDGVEVVAIHVPYHQSMGVVRRLLAFVAFMAAASWFAVFMRGPDVAYVSSTPLTVGVPALLGRWLRGRRFVFEVRDPWPAVPVALGVLKNRAMIAVARWLERMIYRNAKSVVALSAGMTSLVRAAGPPTLRIETVPNCADTELFHPDVDGSEVRRRWGWDDRVVCVHTGAMGRVNGLDILVRAAKHFRNDDGILFVLVGEGRERPALEEACRRNELTNLQFVGGVAKHDMPAVLAAADVCLLTVVAIPVLEHNSANKLFDYLSAGKPVLINYGGWQREAIEAVGAGLGCEMGDEAAFFANIAALKADPSLRTSMGRSARDLAIEAFDRNKLASDALGVIRDAASVD